MDTTLTQNEIVALKECLNYDSREAQLSDNFSNGSPSSFMRALGWNAQQVGGLMSSLMDKGMGYVESDDPGRPKKDDIFWLTDKGVNAVFDVIEREGD